MPTGFAYLDAHSVMAIAHRGGSRSEHPENTLESFQVVIDRGFQFIETDVHASADGQLYAFHDRDLQRVASIAADIGDLTSAELDRIRFHGGYRVPRFDEVLSTWPRIGFNIDPKSDAAVEPLVKAIKRHRATSRVCVGSFSDRRIRYCRDQIGPELCTSMGPLEMARLSLTSRGLPAGTFDAACAQIPVEQALPGNRSFSVTNPALIETAHDLGLKVHVWTINDEAEMRRLLEMGVDGIMTDEPDVLRSVMISHGCWETEHV